MTYDRKQKDLQYRRLIRNLRRMKEAQEAENGGPIQYHYGIDRNGDLRLFGSGQGGGLGPPGGPLLSPDIEPTGGNPIARDEDKASS